MKKKLLLATATACFSLLIAMSTSGQEGYAIGYRCFTEPKDDGECEVSSSACTQPCQCYTYSAPCRNCKRTKPTDLCYYGTMGVVWITRTVLHSQCAYWITTNDGTFYNGECYCDSWSGQGYSDPPTRFSCTCP